MADLADLITVVVVTSPTASDPSTETIDATIESVRGFPEFAPSAPLLIGADGVRPEQRALEDDYAAKLGAVIDRWQQPGMRLTRLPAWGHQANVMRRLLREVHTPLVLFAEHDTPLTPDVSIDWQGCADTLMDGELDSIRFLHESKILAQHEHLITDWGSPANGIPYIRTAQWSQRPHLARTDWYRNIIDSYFAVSSRTMIEDVMHGVVTYYWNTYGRAGLDDHFRLGVYSDPEPTMQRSYHLDGRAGGEKYGMVFAYPGETPEGAPAPTLGRVFE